MKVSNLQTLLDGTKKLDANLRKMADNRFTEVS